MAGVENLDSLFSMIDIVMGCAPIAKKTQYIAISLRHNILGRTNWRGYMAIETIRGNSGLSWCIAVYRSMTRYRINISKRAKRNHRWVIPIVRNCPFIISEIILVEESQNPAIYFTGTERNKVVMKKGTISRRNFFEMNILSDWYFLLDKEYTRPLMKNSSGILKEKRVLV